MVKDPVTPARDAGLDPTALVPWLLVLRPVRLFAARAQTAGSKGQRDKGCSSSRAWCSTNPWEAHLTGPLWVGIVRHRRSARDPKPGPRIAPQHQSDQRKEEGKNRGEPSGIEGALSSQLVCRIEIRASDWLLVLVKDLRGQKRRSAAAHRNTVEERETRAGQPVVVHTEPRARSFESSSCSGGCEHSQPHAVPTGGVPGQRAAVGTFEASSASPPCGAAWIISIALAGSTPEIR